MAESRIVGYVPPPGTNEPTRLLRLKVIAGHNLAKKDIFGASDPYLRIDLVTINGEEVEDSVLTKTKKRTLNPKWEEEFIFRVKPACHKLVLEVFDENRLTRDDFLGMVELPLNNIPRESEGRTLPNKYYILRPRSAESGSPDCDLRGSSEWLGFVSGSPARDWPGVGLRVSVVRRAPTVGIRAV